MSTKTLSLSAVPNASASASVTISNKGTGPLIVNITAPKHNPPFSAVGVGSEMEIPGAGIHDVTVVYAPFKKGSTNDDIVITSNDPTHKKPIKVKIKGKSK